MEIAKTIDPACLAIIMFGLGLGLTISDFARVVKNPKDFFVGFICQVILLPIVAFFLIQIITLPIEIAMGVMIIAAAPGGVTSNILTKTTSFLAFCFFLTSFSLVLISNSTYKKESIIDTIISLLDDVQKNMFNKAKSFQTENTFTVSSYDEFKDILSNKGGFIKCGWDGTSETEAAIKNETKATIRVIPMDENPKGLNCIYSGKPAKHEVNF